MTTPYRTLRVRGNLRFFALLRISDFRCTRARALPSRSRHPTKPDGRQTPATATGHLTGATGHECDSGRVVLSDPPAVGSSRLPSLGSTIATSVHNCMHCLVQFFGAISIQRLVCLLCQRSGQGKPDDVDGMNDGFNDGSEFQKCLYAHTKKNVQVCHVDCMLICCVFS